MDKAKGMIPLNSSPDIQFMQKIDEWSQSNSTWKKEGQTRLVNLVAGAPIAMVGAAYNTIVIIIKLPVTTFRVLTGWIPTKEGHFRDDLPEDTSVAHILWHAYKVVSCSVDILFIPIVGGIWPKANQWVHVKLSTTFVVEEPCKQDNPSSILAEVLVKNKPHLRRTAKNNSTQKTGDPQSTDGRPVKPLPRYADNPSKKCPPAKEPPRKVDIPLPPPLPSPPINKQKIRKINETRGLGVGFQNRLASRRQRMADDSDSSDGEGGLPLGSNDQDELFVRIWGNDKVKEKDLKEQKKKLKDATKRKLDPKPTPQEIRQNRIIEQQKKQQEAYDKVLQRARENDTEQSDNDSGSDSDSGWSDDDW